MTQSHMPYTTLILSRCTTQSYDVITVVSSSSSRGSTSSSSTSSSSRSSSSNTTSSTFLSRPMKIRHYDVKVRVLAVLVGVAVVLVTL